MPRPFLPPEQRRKTILKGYVTATEYEQILESCRLAGISVSDYVRHACLGNKIKSREDAQARRELMKVYGDLGRLGGLLKQAITSGNKTVISNLLHNILKMQNELKIKINNI